MRDAMRLYVRLLAASVRAQMQYRASFVMLSIGGFFAAGFEIAGIWMLFHRFRSLRGWALAEVGMFFGLIHVAMAFGDAFGRGFDTLARTIRTGEFDRVLLRPRRAALQVAGREMPMFRVGRLAQGLIVLLWAANALDVSWTAGRIALAGLAVLGGACLFMGMFVLQATLTFWTIEGLEIMNAFTYGGCETGQYPLSIYRPSFRKFFTFVVPLACVAYFPVLAILGRSDVALGSPLWFQRVCPLAGVAFLLLALQVWKFGVRHYRSTGS